MISDIRYPGFEAFAFKCELHRYGLDDEKAGLSEGLMTRQAGEQNKDLPKRLYFVSGGAKKLLAADGGAGGLQVVAAGVKAFERQTAEGAHCDYRVTQESLGRGCHSQMSVCLHGPPSLMSWLQNNVINYDWCSDCKITW